jgi:uncharacterized protein (DUF1330 family)
VAKAARKFGGRPNPASGPAPVILEFDSMKRLQDWYESAEYRELRRKRFN